MMTYKQWQRKWKRLDDCVREMYPGTFFYNYSVESIEYKTKYIVVTLKQKEKKVIVKQLIDDKFTLGSIYSVVYL